jgi:peptide/nickel transport system permease protein
MSVLVPVSPILVEPEIAPSASLPGLRSGRAALGLVRRRPLGVASATIILLVVLCAIFAPVIARADPLKTVPRDRLQTPSADHWLGTDNLGRDVFSRIVHGARISLWVGFLATVLGTGFGTLVGLTSGYFGGKFDLVSQRLVDAIQVVPGLILALVMISVFGPSITNAIIAIGFVVWPADCRVVRGAVLSARKNVYVEAAEVTGASHTRILVRHILPNIIPSIIVLASLRFPGAILTEASLSFLGLGTPPPAPSWGGMLSGAGRQYMEQVPTLAIFPGLAIVFTVLAFNLFGDTLRDILDPRMRGTR